MLQTMNRTLNQPLKRVMLSLGEASLSSLQRKLRFFGFQYMTVRFFAYVQNDNEAISATKPQPAIT